MRVDIMEQLYEKIINRDWNGTEWTETRTRNGKRETRTFKPCEAASVVCQLEKATGDAEKELKKQARRLLRLAEWHASGKGDGAADALPEE